MWVIERLTACLRGCRVSISRNPLALGRTLSINSFCRGPVPTQHVDQLIERALLTFLLGIIHPEYGARGPSPQYQSDEN